MNVTIGKCIGWGRLCEEKFAQSLLMHSLEAATSTIATAKNINASRDTPLNRTNPVATWGGGWMDI